MLKLFKPLFCEAVGASADWGLVTLAFTRLFDSRNHDISCTTRELETFFEVIDACFRRGGIFTFRDADAATAAAADGAPPATLCELNGMLYTCDAQLHLPQAAWLPTLGPREGEPEDEPEGGEVEPGSEQRGERDAQQVHWS